MSTKQIILIVLLAIGLAVGIGGCSLASYAVKTNNQIINTELVTDETWSQVLSQYQRRFDLIPNIAETVKGYATHEKETFAMVASARASVGQIKVTGNEIPSQEQLNSFAASQQSLGTALSRLMMIQEKYPELKADKGFNDLRAELAGTENRIAVARMDFNKSVTTYNSLVSTFPSSFIADFRGFKKKAYFDLVDKEAEKAPKLKL